MPGSAPQFVFMMSQTVQGRSTHFMNALETHPISRSYLVPMLVRLWSGTGPVRFHGFFWLLHGQDSAFGASSVSMGPNYPAPSDCLSFRPSYMFYWSIIATQYAFCCRTFSLLCLYSLSTY